MVVEGIQRMSNGGKLGFVAALIGLLLLMLGIPAQFSSNDSGGVAVLLGGLITLVGSVLWVARSGGHG